ncbi:carbon-nitrogen hydrolase family protein [Bordetella sp. N]|uniref:carbon-nitrogen hydrolase family protein n=1 Tax=Bordetella sp. N TaxID=1746199 RepID=UPI00070AA9D5|nr:carbon-nitrogen hydrolase family protein [Bordetella sp. N]ALM82859.1 carbon-nitrogen hydrolase [Bordetella sp. N]
MTFTIAAAQSISFAGDIPSNTERHLRFMEAAADHGVNLLVFPELSLTGYEPSVARALALRLDDPHLDPLRDLARQTGMVTVVGAPLLASAADGQGVSIGALILRPDGSTDVYTKQYLHGGEEAVFTAGKGGAHLRFDGANVALGVCADATHPEHAASAAAGHADVYAVGSVISEGAYATESRQLAGYAADHAMVVLLANHGGMTGGWACAGRSTIWAPGGTPVAAAPGVGEMLVLATRTAGAWGGSKVLDLAG